MLARFSNFANISFSDKALVRPNGHVNKQNCVYWSNENPKAKHERPLQSPEVTVRTAISARGITELYFIEDVYGHCQLKSVCANVMKVSGTTASGILWIQSEHVFQQNGATCHATNISLRVVKEKFPEKLISKQGNIS